MIHAFDVDIAKKYGVREAIIFNNFLYWIQLNETNDTNYHDGKFWTYNSIDAMCEIFPYMTKGQIRRSVEKLVSEGLLVKGNYNASTYDRTSWYALGEIGKCIWQHGKIHLANLTNGNGENDKSTYTDIKPDIKPNISADKPQKSRRFIPPTVEEVDEYCRERNNGIDAEAFVAFYESKGWKIGNQNMKSWKAAITTWEKRRKGEKQTYDIPTDDDYNWRYFVNE